MTNTPSKNYELYLKFIDKYLPIGFEGIDRDDPFMVEVEAMTKKNKQFFFIGDMLHIKVLFTSKQSNEMIGIAPENVSPFHLFEASHEEDKYRYDLGLTKLIKMSHQFYAENIGSQLISSNFRIRKTNGKYACFIVQCYLFLSTEPNKTVYILQINTEIDWHKNIEKRFHYYLGNDMSYFNYPNENLLMRARNIFSNREFEILKLIKSKFNNEQIAEKSFLSIHTINTHRRNILKKTGKTNISEVIYDLIEEGLL